MELSEKDRSRLCGHPLFREVPPALLRGVLERWGEGVREYAPGERICCPENHCRKAGLVLSGRATVTTPDAARTVLLQVLTPGSLFGVANLFSEEPYVSLIRADGPCRCVVFAEAAVAQLLDDSPAFRAGYIGFLSDRIRFLNRKIGYLTAGSAERRLALYLASLGQGEVRLTESITSLSDLLNLGRASLYRAFDRLCADGYLIRNGRNLTIPDPAAMLNAYQ